MNKSTKKIESEFERKLLDIARVTRVMAGGKRLSFRATVAIGKKERNEVGIGLGKGKDVSQAIEKAANDAFKNLITVPVKGSTIPFEVSAKYKASKVIIKPSRKGKGIIAGGAVRAVLKLANIKDATAKILSRSSNAFNNARATILALSKLKDFVSEGEQKAKPKQ